MIGSNVVPDSLPFPHLFIFYLLRLHVFEVACYSGQIPVHFGQTDRADIFNKGLDPTISHPPALITGGSLVDGGLRLAGCLLD